MNEAIKQYKQACEEVREAFVQKYYNTYPEWTDESEWVAGDIGGVLAVNDEYWSIADMVTALKLDANEKDLFDWYNDSIDAAIRQQEYYNLENYLKYNSKPLQQSQSTPPYNTWKESLE